MYGSPAARSVRGEVDDADAVESVQDELDGHIATALLTVQIPAGR